MVGASHLHALARALGGEVSRGQILAPATGHSRRDRSLSVRLDPRAPGGFLVHCFGAGDALQEKRRIQQMIRSGATPRLPPVAPIAGVSPSVTGTEWALRLWHEAQAPEGTLVEASLQGRGLTLPPDAPEVMRFHPACPFVGQRTPAMVCLVRDVVSNEPKAVHRTALSSDGRKSTINGKDKLALGPVARGAIKLTADEAVTTCLGVAEGVETALSLRKVPEFGPSPVWSLLSAGGVERLPVLPGLESLWLAVDHDPAGMRAARAAAHRWQTGGAEAYLITPREPRADLNDLFRGACHAHP